MNIIQKIKHYFKLKQIIKGWANLAIRPKEFKATAKERVKKCFECEKMVMYMCTECGCEIHAKTWCMECECPLDKWQRLTDEQITNLIDNEINTSK